MAINPAWVSMRIRELRLERGMSRSQLSRLANIPTGTLAHIEQGINVPMWETICALSDAFGVGANEFQKEPRVITEMPKRMDPRETILPPDSAPENVKMICQMRRDGVTFNEIADKMGVSLSTVHRILRVYKNKESEK